MASELVVFVCRGGMANTPRHPLTKTMGVFRWCANVPVARFILVELLVEVAPRLVEGSSCTPLQAQCALHKCPPT